MPEQQEGILIIDDEPDNIRILSNILMPYYSLKAATTAKEALAILESFSPDLILMDVILPDLDGYRLTRQIKENQKLKDLPVIFVSALDQAEDETRGFLAGGVDYIQKPLSPAIVRARVKNHLKIRAQQKKLEELNRILNTEMDLRSLEIYEMNRALQRANKDLLALSRLKADFLALISHEIRTPLNGIKGFSELLSLSLADNSEYQDYIQQLNLSLARLEGFSKKALLITELESDSYHLNLEKINIKEEIDKALETLMKGDFNDLYDKIVVELKEEYLKADLYLFSLALLYLLDNAFRYNEGDKIYIFSYQVEENIHLEIVNESSKPINCKEDQMFNPYFAARNHENLRSGLSLALLTLITQIHETQSFCKFDENKVHFVISFKAYKEDQ